MVYSFVIDIWFWINDEIAWKEEKLILSNIYISMSKISRSPSIKFLPPRQRMPTNALPRKERAGSQRTIDTNSNDRQSQIETLLRVNEEELMREIK